MITNKYYNTKLKEDLYCYLEHIEALITEINFKGNQGPIGRPTSDIACNLFKQMIENSQVTLYGPFFETIIDKQCPVEYYGVKVLDDNCILNDQFHVSILANEGCKIRYLNDLVNPKTELFKGGPQDVNYLEALCKLKNHFNNIKQNI